MSQGLFAAVSGIRANQTELDVVSNNIANLNTTSFKSSSADFETLFSQTITSGTRPNSDVGGTNPIQGGNGVSVAAINVNFGQGGSLYTGVQSNLLIQGNGFFTIESPNITNVTTGATGSYLTRDGAFNIDGNGNLVTADGNKVMGTATVTGDNPETDGPINIPTNLTIYKEYDANQNVVGSSIYPSTSTSTPALINSSDTLETNNVTLTNYSIGSDGAISATYSNGDRISVQTNPNSPNTREIILVAAEGKSFTHSNTDPSGGPLTVADDAISPQQIQLRMATVTNPTGLKSEGANNYSLAADSGSATFGIANNGGIGSLSAGALESSNVDVSQEFTNMIIAQRGLEACSKVISTESQVLQTVINLIQ